MHAEDNGTVTAKCITDTHHAVRLIREGVLLSFNACLRDFNETTHAFTYVT